MRYQEMLDYLDQAQVTVDGGETIGEVGAGVNEVGGDWVAFARWGGWLWTAWALGDDDAIRRLEARLRHLAPSEGASSDWGAPGCATGETLSTLLPDMSGVPARLGDEAEGPFDYSDK